MSAHTDRIEPPPPLLLPDLQGGTAVVTGVSMGIGRATGGRLSE